MLVAFLFQIAQVIEEIHHYQQNKYSLEPNKKVNQHSLFVSSFYLLYRYNFAVASLQVASVMVRCKVYYTWDQLYNTIRFIYFTYVLPIIWCSVSATTRGFRFCVVFYPWYSPQSFLFDESKKPSSATLVYSIFLLFYLLLIYLKFLSDGLFILN